MHGRTQPLVAKEELWPGMRPSMIASPQSDTVARPTPSEPERTSLDKHGLNETVETKQRVGIIGTGNYAQALVKRLTGRTGCDVIIGSRKPDLRRETLSAVVDFSRSVRLASIEDCIESSDIVILAIHLEDFHTTLQEFAHLLTGKIVVDVSNRESRNVAQSNAEYLSSILPCATVVKAFNSVSAYTMEDISETSVVYVSGNDVAARKKVMTLAQAMGFQAINFGLLTSAGLLEDNNLTVFSLWKIPVAIATGVFTLFSLLVVYMQFIDKRRPGFWHQIFLYVLNKPVCLTAMTTLALTYLPGQLAAILQVYYGTKHRRFPQFLDTWLKFRKQLGLITFFLVTVHAVMSVILLSPDYYSDWYKKGSLTIPANTTLTSDLELSQSNRRMTWRGELASALGILGFLLMALVALTSIKSIGDSLNWSEWRCVQSNLGYVVLAFSAAHDVCVGYPGWIRRGWPKIFKSMTFLSCQLPLYVLLLKLVFSLPPLSGLLRKIRHGWEREDSQGCTVSAGQNGGREKHEPVLVSCQAIPELVSQC